MIAEALTLSRPLMNLDNLQSFLERAGDRLAITRAGLLILNQSGGSPDDLTVNSLGLDSLRIEADELGLLEVDERLAECSHSLTAITHADKASFLTSVHRALDHIARVEAALLDVPLGSDKFLDDVSGFVDASFENLNSREVALVEDFEIDDETLEIFRVEAEELLAGISHNLTSLAASPDDRNALWEIRRNAHTFKGATGIVGLTAASQLAHRVEDLLDKMVELQCGADRRVLDLLIRSNIHLKTLISGTAPDEKFTVPVDIEFDSAIKAISAKQRSKASAEVDEKSSVASLNGVESVRVPAKPMVRVSLERLDELIQVSRGLIENRFSLSDKISLISLGSNADDNRVLERLLDIHRTLTEEMQEKLLRVRMVRFGQLETRLSRAVHITCQEEGKKAFVEITNPDVEIDTQIMDGLVEPLLHLLKNAVAHGIESAETRRLIGKPEKGLIRVKITTDESDVIVSVEDDGCGISASKLKEKAVASGILSADVAANLGDLETWELIFNKGLTTAETINLNAGRGIGMNIVRESVEGRGGSVSLRTEPQTGTMFTIRLPRLVGSLEREFSEEKASTGARQPVVLVVEDSSTIRHHNVKLIEATGCKAITANDGAEALELLLTCLRKPDVIITDVEMPNMDGWKLLEYVKTDDNFGAIPMVMLTSLDADEHQQRAAGLGASEYIIKPLTKEVLEEKLSATIGDIYRGKS